MRRLVRRLCARTRRAQLVEFALVLPMLLLVVLGIAEFGFIFQRYEVVTNAAREGARMAVLPGYTTADVISASARLCHAGPGADDGGQSRASSSTNVTIPVGGGLPAISAKRVTVTYTHTLHVPPEDRRLVWRDLYDGAAQGSGGNAQGSRQLVAQKEIGSMDRSKRTAVVVGVAVVLAARRQSWHVSHRLPDAGARPPT